MDGLSSESEVQKPADEQKPDGAEDAKGAAKPKKPRVTRKKPEKTLPPAAADVPAAAPVDAEFFGEKAKVLRVNLGTYPDVIDPQKSSFVNEIAHLNKFYEGLTRLDASLAEQELTLH